MEEIRQEKRCPFGRDSEGIRKGFGRDVINWTRHTNRIVLVSLCISMGFYHLGKNACSLSCADARITVLCGSKQELCVFRRGSVWGHAFFLYILNYRIYNLNMTNNARNVRWQKKYMTYMWNGYIKRSGNSSIWPSSHHFCEYHCFQCVKSENRHPARWRFAIELNQRMG